MPKKITQNVNKDKILNDLPKVSPEMSSWKNKHANYQSCNLGHIVPIYYEEVLPKERKKITMGMISHTTTPVAPIFNSMYTEIRSFFVPLRLCADLLNGYKDRKSPWVKVFGEDPSSTSADIIVPLLSQKLPDVSSQFVTNFNNAEGQAWSASQNNIFDSLDLGNISNPKDCNFLNIAAYELIYQRHYRNENYESSTDSPLYKLLYNAYNTTGSYSMPAFSFEKANREKDYFTGAKPFTQKGDPIRVNVGSEASVKVKSASGAISDQDDLKIVASESIAATGGTALANLLLSDDTFKGRLVADLSTAQGVSIEELRLLIKTQELLEKDAIYGSIYASSLNAHFGTCPLDLTLQDPQELFKVTITSNMQAIFQTSSTSGEASILGTIGANSTTQTDPFVILPETEFKEHGIVMVCAVHKLQNVYDSRFFKPKFLFKKARFDFYTPELNDLGYQPISNKEMTNSSSPVAGYNEAFAEYRYVFNKSHGKLNTNFNYWSPAISNEYSSIAAMYKEGSAILDKALSVTSGTAPQFYDAWGFEEVVTKPMSLHSIPGMDGVI